jgi:molybdate transport system permease protein
MSDRLVAFTLQVALLGTLLAGLVGLPAAWLLGRRRFKGRALLGLATLLPLLLPPTVLAYYLVSLLGDQGGMLHALLHRAGIAPAFGAWGAVVAAAVGSFPLFVRTAQMGFEQVDGRLEDAARTLGRSEASVFWTVTLPLGSRGVVLGLLLGACRALGDVLLTVVVASALGPGLPTLFLPLGEATVGWPVSAALATVSMVPLLIGGRFGLNRVEGVRRP